MSAAPVRTFPDNTDLPSAKLQWELVERVLACPQLKRSARLREFLLFVGQRSLQEGCTKINEQEIGAKVFGRAKNYDTSVDNIVRVNATELRKRIESYFESEGAQEPLVLEIPRGSYVPVFRSRLNEPTLQTEIKPAFVPASSPAPIQSPSPRPKGVFFLFSTIIVMLVIACGMLWTQNRRLRQSLAPWGSTPVLGAFWSEFLNANQETDVVVADTSFALLEDITQRPISLNAYLSRSYLDQLQSGELSADRRSDLNLIVSRNFGSLGDFRVAQRIMALDPTAAQKFHLFYAREYAPALIKQNNVILIGGRKSNPWVDLFEERMNFVIQYDPIAFTSSIKNRFPTAGEQQVYISPHSPQSSVGYSIVAYLPNTDKTGKTLIIEGTGSQATEAAGDFLTSENQLSLFKKTLGVRKLPYFEVLLETRLVNSTPMDTKIIAYRTYPG